MNSLSMRFNQQGWADTVKYLLGSFQNKQFTPFDIDLDAVWRW
jgi:hypothetical protein